MKYRKVQRYRSRSAVRQIQVLPMWYHLSWIVTETGCAAVVWEARVVVPADPADRVVCNMEETMIQLKGIRKSFYEGTANKAAKLNPIEALRYE